MTVSDCSFGVVDCRGGRSVFVVVWVNVGVHIAAADESTLAEKMAEGGQEVCGWNMSGREVRCRGCAIGEGTGNAVGVDAGGFREGGKRRFEGEGVGVEPG